ILYDAKVSLPAEVVEAFPLQLPPLRADQPTLLVGKMKAAKELAYTVTGRVAGAAEVRLACSEKVPEAELDNFFLVGLVQQWARAKAEPALIRADRALMLAMVNTKVQRQDLLLGAQLAIDKNHFEAAAQLFKEARRIFPHDPEALAGLKLVANLKDGKVTREMIKAQLEKA